MNRKHSNNAGFTVVEALLILIFLAIVGFAGYYVWHQQKGTDKTGDATKTSSQSAKIASQKPTTSNQKYVTIPQWGVKASYDGSLTLSYTLELNNAVARFSAKQMDDLVADSSTSCTGYAGSIARVSGDEYTEDHSETVAQAAAANSAAYTKVGNYYYQFQHAQAACEGPNPSDLSSAKEAQLETLLTQANNDVKSIAANLQAIR